MAGLPTGVVCGVYGRMGLKADGDGGKFFVEDVVFPRTPGPTTTKKEEEATDRSVHDRLVFLTLCWQLVQQVSADTLIFENSCLVFEKFCLGL